MRLRLRDGLTRLVSALVPAVVIVVVVALPALADWSASTARSQTMTAATLAAPTGLTAVHDTCVVRTSWPVDLSWTATTSTFADGYEILRSTTAGGPYSSVGTVAGTSTTTFTDTSTTFGTTYFYVVQAKRNLWRSANSNAATVTTLKRNCT